MPKTQWIELKSLIKKTWVSFLTVVLLVCVSIAVYYGFEWSCLGVRQSVETHLANNNMHNFEIFGQGLLTEGDVERVEAVEGIDEAVGCYTDYEFYSVEDKRLQTKIVSITNQVDKLCQIEGGIPSRADEIAVEKHWAKIWGIEPGDRITFDADGGVFGGKEFIVTGLAESPAYISNHTTSYGVSPTTLTPVELIAFADESAFEEFKMYSSSGYYSSILAVSKELPVASFSDEYKEKSDEIAKRIENELPGDTVVLGRTENTGINIADNGFSMFDNLKLSLGMLLYIISQIVCIICIAGVINKEQQLIGGKIAMGFKRFEIIRLYAVYSALAAVIGTCIGVPISRFIIEKVFISTAQTDILFDVGVPYFSMSEVLIELVFQIFIGIITAAIASHRILINSALMLLRGAEKTNSRQRFFEKSKLWQKCSLLTKTIINNMLNNKGRMFSTIVSIAGCTVLCVSSIAVKDLVAGSFERHYDKLQGYDSIVYFNPEDTQGATDIENVLDKEGMPFAKAHTEIGMLRTPDDKGIGTYLFVMDNEAEGLFNWYNLDGEKLKLDDNVYISCAYAEEYELGIGDEINYVDESGNEQELVIDGVIEYYLQMPCIFMNSEKYEDVFGKEPVKNAFMTDSGKTGCVDQFEDFVKISGYISTFDFYETSKLSFNSMNNACTIIMSVFLFLATVMAVFVILNLLISFVNSKRFELVYMRVNGYSIEAVERYIYTEICVLTLIGIPIGNLFGHIFGRITLDNLSGYTDFFLQNHSLYGGAVGCLSTALLVALAALVALGRIRSFKLTEVNTK